MSDDAIKVTEVIVSAVKLNPGDVLFINLRTENPISHKQIDEVREVMQKRLADAGLSITVIAMAGVDGFDLATVTAEQMAEAGYVRAAILRK